MELNSVVLFQRKHTEETEFGEVHEATPLCLFLSQDSQDECKDLAI